MAVARCAHVDAVSSAGRSGRVFQLSIVGDDALGFVGGQYVIVDTGVTLSSGKRAKRAYSILSSDEQQLRFEIAVKKLPGPGSCAMHEMAVGGTLSFSGPWGKYAVDAEMGGRTLVFATDTGITAAIGLVRGRGFERLGRQACVIWYVCEPEDFIAEPLVRAALERNTDRVLVERALPIGHPERAAHAQSVVFRHMGETDAAFLSGDGAVIHALRDALGGAGVGEGQVCIESFFNSPQRRTS